jgi:hypothetical protein
MPCLVKPKKSVFSNISNAFTTEMVESMSMVLLIFYVCKSAKDRFLSVKARATNFFEFTIEQEITGALRWMGSSENNFIEMSVSGSMCCFLHLILKQFPFWNASHCPLYPLLGPPGYESPLVIITLW